MKKYALFLEPANIDPDRKVTRAELAALTRCPKCGGEIVAGFGLAFGGYGSYKMCDADGCDFAAKAAEEGGDEP